MSADLFAVRSLLFLPASNPRAIARARSAGADLVILDLEDAVADDDKLAARAAAVDAVADPWPVPVAIRVNGEATGWHRDDLAAVAGSRADFVVVPRAERAESVASAATGKPVMAMIETAAGVLAAPDVARHCAGLIAGTNDLAADLRVPPGGGRAALTTALHMTILAARSAGIAVFDGVFNAFKDLDGFAKEASEGAAMGFDGKSLIHPDQVATCHAAFSPSDAAIADAEALVTAFQGGAQALAGRMIERMHVESARRLLRRARN